METRKIEAGTKMKLVERYYNLDGNFVQEKEIGTFRVWDKNTKFAWNVDRREKSHLVFEEGKWFYYRDEWARKKDDWLRTSGKRTWYELVNPKVPHSAKIEKGTIEKSLEVIE